MELSTQAADLSFAFDDAENLLVVAMTDREMEGAALPPVAIYYGVRYGVSAIYAGARWLNANSHTVQINHHRIRNWWRGR